MAGLLAGGAVCLGCGATPATAPRPTPVATSPGDLGVQVTSVTPTLEPYNPQLADQGIPAEQVDFAIRPGPGGSPVSCTIGVFRSGREVGSTTMVGPGSSSQSIDVAVRGANFDGSPSDARVRCHRS